MDWFERLTGFRETKYDDTHAKLKVDGSRLQSLINGKSYGIGELEPVPLQALRERVKSAGGTPGRLKACVVTGNVRQMHQSRENAGALFQVASQFNLLEMTSYDVTPEHGVTRYQLDRTQGPACAIAAGAATIYRNYFAPVGGSDGQTAERQFDGLADLGAALGDVLNQPVKALWSMQNGYALCTRARLDAIAKHLGELQPDALDSLRGKLSIGVHRERLFHYVAKERATGELVRSCHIMGRIRLEESALPLWLNPLCRSVARGTGQDAATPAASTNAADPRHCAPRWRRPSSAQPERQAACRG